MPTGPACGWRQGKILGRRGRRAGDGHRNPAMQPGALPDGESRPIVAVPSSPHAGPKIRRQGPALSTPIHRGRSGSEETPRWILGRSQQSTAPNRSSNSDWPPCALAETAWAHPEPGPRDSGLAAANLEPTRRPATRLPKDRHGHHADRLVRSCALTCDIRIGPSENSPTLAFSVRPRK